MEQKDRYTIKYTEELAQQKGGHCLSVKITRQELLWKCQKGHLFKATIRVVEGGKWCPICEEETKPPSIKEIRKIERIYRGKCLSKNFSDTSIPLQWECGNGHKFERTLQEIKNNKWCSICDKNQKKMEIFEDLCKIAESEEGKCLSKRYIDRNTKLIFQCKEGHIWETKPDIIRKGSWCPICAGKEKHTIQEMREIAEIRGGKCLSKIYKSTTTKLTWQCKEGHIWETIPKSILKGHWCPYCAKIKRHTLEYIQELAEKKGGKCLSDKYYNQYVKLKFQCDRGHIWETVPKAIIVGQWCKQCYIEKMKESIFARICQFAESKGGKCLSEKYVNEKTKLLFQCKEGHIFEIAARAVRNGHWCQVCSLMKFKREYVKHCTLEEMQQLAEKRGGKCLSDKYINLSTKLLWQCKEGHIWEARPGSIKKGTWCPYCSKKKRYTLEDVQKYAETKGGKCLSDKYINVFHPLLWQCKEGHQWERAFYVTTRGHWCPVCLENERKLNVLKKLKEIAESKGGKCLSDEYINNYTKLKFECINGHIWETIPKIIKKGSWCPICYGEKKVKKNEITSTQPLNDELIVEKDIEI